MIKYNSQEYYFYKFDIFSIRKSLKHFLLYGIIDLEIDRSPKKVSVTWCRNSVYTVPKLLVIVFQKQKDGNPHGRQLIHPCHAKSAFSLASL